MVASTGARRGSVGGTARTWSAFAAREVSPSVPMAITCPSRALASCMLESIFSYTRSWRAIATTGTSRSMRAMGPCFISPAG
jgi:hypothetical protein